MEKIRLNRIDETVLHDIQLVDTFMSSVHCDCDKEKIAKGNIKTEISIDTRGIAIDRKTGESIINVEIESEAFKIYITQTGKFKINDVAEIEEKLFEKFLAIQGIRLLWSFVRENVYEISCKMLRKPIMLPTLDVMKTLQKSTEEDVNED